MITICYIIAIAIETLAMAAAVKTAVDIAT